MKLHIISTMLLLLFTMNHLYSNDSSNSASKSKNAYLFGGAGTINHNSLNNDYELNLKFGIKAISNNFGVMLHYTQFKYSYETSIIFEGEEFKGGYDVNLKTSGINAIIKPTDYLEIYSGPAIIFSDMETTLRLYSGLNIRLIQIKDDVEVFGNVELLLNDLSDVRYSFTGLYFVLTYRFD